MIIFFVSVNELLLEQLTVDFVYFKEFTLSGSVMQPVPPLRSFSPMRKFGITLHD